MYCEILQIYKRLSEREFFSIEWLDKSDVMVIIPLDKLFSVNWPNVLYLWMGMMRRKEETQHTHNIKGF